VVESDAWRAVAAAVGAGVLTWGSLPWLLPALRRLRLVQLVREQGPTSHQVKAGTPTMGGLVFVPVAALAAWALDPADPALLVALVVTLGHAALGFADDFLKVARGRSLGLRAREKVIGQILLALALAAVARGTLGLGGAIPVPFTAWRWDPGPWYPLLVVLLVLGTANATNLTDGLDGLLAGSAVPLLAAFGVIAALQAATGAAVLAGAMGGACLGFLTCNRHPARVFMGDTGSLAIGGCLAALAVLLRAELWLVVLGGLYVVETLSVIVQVTSFRLFGRRLLRMSPLHHHLELAGWPETVVVARLWLLAALLAAVGLWGFLTMGG
jgi:phospho-N-acetylmuramoyl-pentapeptide-transferase